MRNLLIHGTGNTAILAADVASVLPDVNLVAFVESVDPERCDTELEGRPVCWMGELASLAQDHVLVCAMPNGMQRSAVERVAEHEVEYTSLIVSSR